MLKGAVKGVAGLNKDWRQEWATDPVGTAVGLLGLLGIGKGVKAGSPYLSGKANVMEFLTKDGIPAEQVADTFKAIEKAQGLMQQLPAPNQEDLSSVTAGSVPRELGAVEQPPDTSESVENVGPQEMQQGPPKDELDFLENPEDAPKSGAIFGLPEAEAPTAYSVAFETRIHPSGAGTRSAHFRAANDALLSAMEASPELAERMSQLAWISTEDKSANMGGMKD